MKTETLGDAPPSLESRLPSFWARVSPEPNSGCWLWDGGWHSNGYGAFYDGQRSGMAHRFAYRCFVGEIPDGLQLDHKCRVRCCVNPDHLQLVTSGQNTMLGFGPTAVNHRKDTCNHGHLLTPENVRISMRDGRPRRHCRTCARRHKKKDYRRKLMKIVRGALT